MKKILFILAVVFVIQACDYKHGDPEIPADTYPSILGQWPSGSPGTYSVTLGNTLEIELQFAPSRYATGVWYIDEVEYTRGTKLSFTPEVVGTHELYLEVSNGELKTSRSAIITVQ